MSDIYESDKPREPFQDELVGLAQHGQSGRSASVSQQQSTCDDLNNNKRQVRLILDHTAFVRGIGNVKRWFNEEYIGQNLNKSFDPIKLNMYVPSYTLHEFDYVKRGTSISATNAREAIKFIDNYLEKFSNNHPTSNGGKIQYNLNLESPNEATPVWKTCSKYKIYSPKIGDFPNYKTRFECNQTRQTRGSQTAEDESQIAEDGSQIAEDGSQNAEDGDGNENDHTIIGILGSSQMDQDAAAAVAASENLAEMPNRLRYLIRTCIFKRFIEKYQPKPKDSIEEWKLVTEDPVTKIWAKSYGIDCVNVNEAELLIFQNYDVNSFRVYNPFSSGNDDFDPKNDILQNRIDTTLYAYHSVKQEPPKATYRNRRRGKGKQAEKTQVPIEGVVHEKQVSGDGNETIKKEKFKAINYAPRGHGELWEP
ncbi:NMD4 [Candida oxycetoniae]|uniref:NMD4 n=1 Tax=Candida oxycetoniae TaxID=497107 RepID=A0AAI9WXT5_9ASCO|nr:NMD4 [Candida oxycetoniae]KAI3404408.2 NMD4 [Candida oxycetoniae]